MRVLVTGSTGLLGQALVHRLRIDGHAVWTLDRQSRGEQSLAWPLDAGQLAARLPSGLDTIVHLAGAPIATWPWTAAVRAELWASRVERTAGLARALVQLAEREGRAPHLISASAVGIYRCGWPAMDEDGPRESGTFMGRLCQAWEAATQPAREAGASVGFLRTGLVLDPNGGLLAKLLPVWKLGLGGCLGPRDTPWSWIHREDWLDALRFLLEKRLDGPYNLCAPHPLRQEEALRCLGRVLGRRGSLHVPGWLLHLGGQMPREVLLQAPAALPRRLLEAGFHFHHPELEEALKTLLGHPAP